MRRIASVALLLSVACNDSGFRTWPDLPADTATVIIVVTAPGRLEVHSRAWEPNLRFDTEFDEQIAITVLAYRDTLDELGFLSGSLERTELDTCGARSLLPATSMFLATDDGWEARVEAPELRDLRLEGRCPCAEFETVWETTWPESLAGSTRAHQHAGALYAVSGRRALRGAFTVGSTVSAFETTIRPESSWISDAGTLFLGNRAGLYRWNGPEASTSTSLLEDTAGVFAIDGREDETGVEIFIGENAGRARRFDGTDWSELEAVGSVRGDGEQQAAVVYSGPGVAHIALHDQLGILSYVRGESTLIDNGELAGIQALARTDAWGVIAGDTLGRIARISNDETELVRVVRGVPSPTGAVRQFVQFRGGALYVTRDGLLGQVHPSEGVCVPAPQPGFVQLQALAIQQERVALVGKTPEDGALIRFMDPRPGP